MTTSFDTPRVFGHHNPFASFQDTTDDPLATTSTNNSTSGFGGSAGGGPNTSTDPWSSYYIPPVASTSNHTASPSSALSNVVDEEAIPELYTQAWNAALTSSSSTATTGSSFGSTFNTGNTISLGILQRVLSGCAGLGASETEKIINLVSGSTGNLAGSSANIAGSPTSPFRAQSGGSTSNGRVSKLEFYVALALAALSQNREAVTIQAVALRRNDLPIPKLDLYSLQNSSTFTSRPSNARNASSSTTPYRAHKMSLGSQSDPWGSTNEGSTSATVNANGQSSSQSNHHQEDPSTASPSRYSHTSTQPPMYSPPRGERIGRSTDQNGYSSFPRYNEEDEDGATIGGSGTREASTASYSGGGGGGFQAQSAGGSSSSSDSTLFNLPQYTTAQQLYNSMEKIKVIQSDELQGNFLTRHTVYKVIQEKKGIEVLRRYSDWIALNDYLEGKYAGRIRLTLPPKRVGISARHVHIASDEQFLLRRRRGLSRYLNVLINHPIYKNDKIVSTFFNNDQSSIDFSAYKKIHQNDQFVITEGINDEASIIGKLSTSQESLIPIFTTFESILSTLRESLPGLIESLTRLCALIERINYRSLQNQSDLMRARLSFDSFAETYKGLSNGSHASRPREIEEETTILNRDLNHLSDKIGIMNELTESHTGNFENEIILEERMKLQRDLWRSLLVLLNKYESKLKHDNIDKLKKRIEGYQSKYSTINNTPVANRKNNADEEMKKLVKNIEDDQNEIERLFNRRVFYKWSILAEIRLVWRWSTVMRVDLADLASEENKFYSQISRIWAGLDTALSIDT